MNTTDIFLRWYDYDEFGDEIPETSIFKCVADLEHEGIPRANSGKALSNDGLVWVLDKDGDYEILAY